MTPLHYLRIWLACARYSLVRTMMFRFDFLMWSAVEFCWMSVNLLLIGVIFSHTKSIAGWGLYEMMLLLGTGMVLQRLMMGFFWSNLFELGRNIRSGQFDFFLAQPGHPLFMISTRKLDPDILVNSLVAIGVVIYAMQHLGLHPSFFDVTLYVALLGFSLMIQYAIVLLVVSITFWAIGSQGVESTYFTLFEFSRLPRPAFRGIMNVVFVYALPTVVVTFVPVNTLLHGLNPLQVLWLGGVACAWVTLAIFVFNRGLKRYSSASS